jgi:hypothetical protein
MAWTKTTKTIVRGTVVLLVLVAAMVMIVFRHKIADQITLAGGRHTIASHMAMTTGRSGLMK